MIENENASSDSINIDQSVIVDPLPRVQLSKQISNKTNNGSDRSDSTLKLPNQSSTNIISLKNFFKNYKQPLSLLPAWFQLLAIGMMVFKVQHIPTVIMYSKGKAYAFNTVFYIGTIIGVIPTALLLRKIKKVFLYYLASLVCTASCIIYFGETKLSLNQLIGSFLTGLSFGIILITFLAHSSEISIKYLRGTNIGITLLALEIGIYFGALAHCKGYEKDFDDFQIIGIALLSSGIITILISYFVSIESPIYYWEKEQVFEAKRSLLTLRNEMIETDQIKYELNDIRATILCQPAIFKTVKKEDVLPFAKIILFRFSYVLATALPINLKFVNIFKIYFKSDDTEWHLIFLPRLLMSIFTLCNIEKAGRRTFLILSNSLAGLTLITIGFLSINFKNEIEFNETVSSQSTSLSPLSVTSLVLPLLVILIILYQSFLGLGYNLISYIYMAEGFPYGRKNFLNAFVVISESLIQIIIIASINYMDNIQNIYVCIAGLLQLWIAGIAIKFAPETRNTTLLDAQQLFRNRK